MYTSIHLLLSDSYLILAISLLSSNMNWMKLWKYFLIEEDNNFYYNMNK